MTELHRLKITGKTPHPAGWRVELDGEQVFCSRLELTAGMDGFAVVTLTLPGVLVDLDADVVDATIHEGTA